MTDESVLQVVSGALRHQAVGMPCLILAADHVDERPSSQFEIVSENHCMIFPPNKGS
jgi:hypothetical protein